MRWTANLGLPGIDGRLVAADPIRAVVGAGIAERLKVHVRDDRRGSGLGVSGVACRRRAPNVTRAVRTGEFHQLVHVPDRSKPT